MLESAIAIAVYALFTVIGCTYFVFGESLSKMNIFGIMIGLIALFMMIF